MTEKFPDSLARLVETQLDGYQIQYGLDDDLAAQLIEKSKQRHIRATTPKDAAKRFKDIEALTTWEGQGRDVYALTAGQNLAGVIWYGEKPLPLHLPYTGMRLPHHTFAVRTYSPYRGKHLARPFMEDTLRDYMQVLSQAGELDTFRGLWLTVNNENARARQLYRDFGYKEVAFLRETREDIMVLPVQEIANKLGS